MTATLPAQLPCGAAVDDLLEQVADGRASELDAHEGRCVHCQAMLRELDQLWAPVRSYAAEPITAPAGLLDGVVRQMRALFVDVWHVIPGDDGTTRIGVRVVETIARRAAGRVPGVVTSLSKRGETSASASLAGSSIVIEVCLVARYGLSLTDLARQVRRAAVRELRALTGLDGVVVNVRVDDVRVRSRTGGPVEKGRPTRRR